MEDLIADYKLKIKELRSLIVILQKAIQNEADCILEKDIDNYLELAINNIDNLSSDINKLEENLLSQI